MSGAQHDRLAQRRADAAERQRKSRQRRRDGLLTVLVDIRKEQVGALVRCDWKCSRRISGLCARR
jgi:hypothetical protein